MIKAFDWLVPALAGCLTMSIVACGEEAGDPQPTRAVDETPAPGLPEIAGDAPTRFPVEVDGKWGYIDRDGAMVIEPRFDAAGDFHEQLAAVAVDGLFGYVDPSGALVIEPAFEHAGVFSEGLAAVMPAGEDTLIGYIDTSGDLVIGAEFRAVSYFQNNPESSRFSEGLAAVRPGKGREAKRGYIDVEGEWFIEPRYDQAGAFAQGRAPVRESSRSMFIDRNTETVLEGEWSRALPFSEGLAAVAMDPGGRSDAWHYIDSAGEIAAQPTFGSGGSAPARARSFSEGLAAVYYDGARRWEYILPSGERADFVTVEPHRWFHRAGPFRGGLARVELLRRRQNRGGTGETLYIDRHGNRVWPTRDADNENPSAVGDG